MTMPREASSHLLNLSTRLGKAAASPPNESGRPAAEEWKPQQVVVDMPEAGQAAVTVAKPALVAVTALGDELEALRFAAGG